MSQFDQYAAYYDLLYKDKDYQGEAAYINNMIREYGGITKDIIDLGCGTGIHAQLLSELGYKVTGVDMSKNMIERARKRAPELDFICNDLQTFEADTKVDCILALFHVMSYQSTNKDLIKAINNIKKHLKKGGLFLFDVWHGPAVLNIKPSVQVKRLTDGNLTVTRIAEPAQDFEKNCVDVNYQVFIKNNTSYDELKEIHKMRYFFKPELDFILGQYGMEIIHSEEWLTGKKPNIDSWGVLYVVRNAKAQLAK